MLWIDAEHRGAKTTTVIERNDEAVRIFVLEPIHEMDLCPDGPPGAGRRLRDAFNNVFG